MFRSSEKIGQLVLRAGVALAFLYPPYDALTNPSSWVGYFPKFVLDFPLDPLITLHAFGVLEVIIAVWLLSGWKVRVPALIAAVLLLAIVGFNLPQFPILFRDVAIAFAALAIAILPRPEQAIPQRI